MRQVRPALLSVLVLTLLMGGIFPLLLFALAVPLFPRQTSGSLLRLDGMVIGSSLIGQDFTGREWFQPRPSAAGAGYDATASGGTNLAPGNRTLADGGSGFVGIRSLSEEYRRRNGLSPDTPIPIDAVTRSGSGLDPDISPANALLQVARIARARNLPETTIRRLVEGHVVGPQLGFLGDPRVSVLELNLALLHLQREPSAASQSGP